MTFHTSPSCVFSVTNWIQSAKSTEPRAEDSAMYGFASGVSTAMLSGIFAAISIMVCMTVSALIYRSAMGGQKDDSGIRGSECFGWEKYCFRKKWIIGKISWYSNIDSNSTVLDHKKPEGADMHLWNKFVVDEWWTAIVYVHFHRDSLRWVTNPSVCQPMTGHRAQLGPGHGHRSWRCSPWVAFRIPRNFPRRSRTSHGHDMWARKGQLLVD